MCYVNYSCFLKPFTIPVQDKEIIKHSGIPLEILQTIS